jgi:hypothetical protein
LSNSTGQVHFLLRTVSDDDHFFQCLSVFNQRDNKGFAPPPHPDNALISCVV